MQIISAILALTFIINPMSSIPAKDKAWKLQVAVQVTFDYIDKANDGKTGAFQYENGFDSREDCEARWVALQTKAQSQSDRSVYATEVNARVKLLDHRCVLDAITA